MSVSRTAERYKQLGNASYKEGEYAEALEFYTKAIFHNPNNAGYYGNRSATLLMLEKYQRALEDAVKSIKLDERFVKGYLRAAKCHLMLGYPSLSIDYYRKVLEQAPTNTQAKHEASEETQNMVYSCEVFILSPSLPRPSPPPNLPPSIAGVQSESGGMSQASQVSSRGGGSPHGCLLPGSLSGRYSALSIVQDYEGRGSGTVQEIRRCSLSVQVREREGWLCVCFTFTSPIHVSPLQ